LLFAQKKPKDEIEHWNDVWYKYSNEWNNLKTRCENIIKVYKGEKSRSKLPSVKNLSDSEERDIILRMLKNYTEEHDSLLSTQDLIAKYNAELIELCKYDKDTQALFGFVNTWWVFGEVAKELNYKIFMAEAENIGYKRTKRGEKPMPNDLYRTNTKGEVIIDDGILETILDYMRIIQWD
jgi:type I restriction enzyme M protein